MNHPASLRAISKSARRAARFIECLREQHLEEIAEFASEIASAVRERDALNGGLLSVQSACDAVKGLDPAKPSAEIEQFVARGFGVNR